jgi:biopolymer transport protein ExbD
MGMNVGGKKGIQSNINITPYIAILLVLLIIFMVAAPLKQYDHPVRVPQPAMSAPQQNVKSDSIIVEMDLAHTIRLNQQIVTLQELESTLSKVFQSRAVKNIFIRGDSALPYGDVFVLMDIAKRAGATDIALLEKSTVASK